MSQTEERSDTLCSRSIRETQKNFSQATDPSFLQAQPHPQTKIGSSQRPDSTQRQEQRSVCCPMQWRMLRFVHRRDQTAPQQTDVPTQESKLIRTGISSISPPQEGGTPVPGWKCTDLGQRRQMVWARSQRGHLCEDQETILEQRKRRPETQSFYNLQCSSLSPQVISSAWLQDGLQVPAFIWLVSDTSRRFDG